MWLLERARYQHGTVCKGPDIILVPCVKGPDIILVPCVKGPDIILVPCITCFISDTNGSSVNTLLISLPSRSFYYINLYHEIMVVPGPIVF